MQRGIYGPDRLKGPVLRKGWKDWADAGFPSLSDKPELRKQYKFDNRVERGFQPHCRVSFRHTTGDLTDIALNGVIVQ
jgi:hypothetical protein